MIKNKQSARSLTAFLVTWSFIVITVTGIVLYIVPQGRIAYWVHWSLTGLEKEQWGHVHMTFGGIFIVTGILHLYFNWKPFKKYLAERVKGHTEVSRELVISLVLSVIVVVLSIYRLPPVSWVFDLNETIKDAWVTSPDLEPPFGHAEEVSLAGMARRMNFDLQPMLEGLREADIQFESLRDSLDKIARANNIRPMDVYAVMRRYERKPESTQQPLSSEDIEARYSGTGLGRKTLPEVCEQVGVDIELARRRLASGQLSMDDGETFRNAAERYGVNPIDLLKVVLNAQEAPME